MALELFDQVYPYLNGALVSKATSVQTGLTSDDQSVLTIALGYAGISPSPDIREVTIENVVPIDGIEFEVEKYKLQKTVITLKLQFGGSGMTYEGKGFITSVSIDAGVGKTTSLSFTFRGEGKEFS
jgi:hypothetical protein